MIPEDLQYSADHEWIRLDGDTATIGITDYAQDQLGDIVYLQLPAVGDTVEAGAVIGELESTKSVSDLFAPVTGEIVSVNDTLEASPETVNADPYGQGWLITVRVADPAALDGLMDAAAYGAATES
ncbi:glycine cleavage system protein GcvH [Mumia sp. zg.B53]|uniref:glycine cleavage system protein GcvH n=1 Tax=unclassified Mumia TaxID=2621872 RepID=UPI001C6EF38F|nr:MULTISPECIES: glycine cleavage system protein GcvH [unclassified Mumia]MBW9205004.1 glycine cleavage system protein GcvH [Mumia sp. zg.B17]MBW9208991.1 glycine cleavage system protein GcvH [Mumia sp. zg.B21]MBW9213602.1 glycine cleavage system protein GcvH [Mumia sp. zg.B53]MDD9347494.1 glycine cleavage system protein GcvH [Mumia sp.]